MLESSLNNTVALPKMITSSGYYQVKKQGKDVVVEYYQRCQFTKSLLTDLYLNIIKNEAIQFMERLLEYSNKICSNKPEIDNQFSALMLSELLRNKTIWYISKLNEMIFQSNIPS